jgi:PKD repeat protein/predicted esterase
MRALKLIGLGILLVALAAGCPAKERDAAPPEAEFTADVTSGPAELSVQFSDLSLGTVTSWTWDFGDSGGSTEQNPAYAYTAAGTYTVTLTVSGPGGSDARVRINYISVSAPLTTVDFSADVTSGPAHLDVQFTDLSSSTETITAWSWDFGDLSGSSVQNPSHTYTAAGTYTVSLTVTTASGTPSETKTDYVSVSAAQAFADFSATPTSGTASLAVQFTDTTSATEPIVSWSWDFGDGGSSAVQNPGHTYTRTGSYTVSLTVTTATTGDTETKTGFIAASHPSKPTSGSGGGTGSLSGTYNSRAYRLYVPSSYTSSTPAPLVACFHGYGDTHTNFFNVVMITAWKTAADNQGFILFVPQHKNPNRPSFLHLSGGSTLDMTSTLAEMDDVVNCIYYGAGATHNVETTAVYWIGFSEGGTFSDLAGWKRSPKIRAIAPYAGYVSGKTFPISRDVPVYSICGKSDPFYSGAPAAHQEWVNAGHDTNSSWVDGVGHLFTGLCSSGPGPESVYTWMRDAQSLPVVSGLP